MKKIISLLTLLTFYVLSIIAGPSDWHYLNGEKWIPATYSPTNSTLLIKNYSYSYTNRKGKQVIMFEKEQKKMEEFMKENYSYPYEFMSDTSDAKYKDTDKYRYVITFDQNNLGSTYGPKYSTPGTVGGNGNMNSVGMSVPNMTVACVIKDRKLGETWKSSGKVANYGYGSAVLSMTVNTMLYIYNERNKK